MTERRGVDEEERRELEDSSGDESLITIYFPSPPERLDQLFCVHLLFRRAGARIPYFPQTVHARL